MEVIVKKVADFVARHGLKPADTHALVALSGGADSVALLRILLTMGVKCTVVHCNFCLRGDESNRDEEFVRQLCDIHNVPLRVKHFDVAEYEREHRVSTEMACRELRYAWFEEERVSVGADVIAVAHHHDDNVETLFLNLLRGSGLQGLAGIKYRNGVIVRPLLCLTRVEIEEYLCALRQDYVVDSTNLENDYKRNKIRNVILPCVRSLFPNADVGLARSLQNLQGCNELYQWSVEQMKCDIIERNGELFSIHLASLRDMKVERDTMMFELLKEFGFNSVDSANISKAIGESDGVGNCYLSATHKAVIERETIDVFPHESEDISLIEIDLPRLLNDDNPDFVISAQYMKSSSVKDVNGRDSIALDMSVLQKSPMLTMRRWQIGDRIRPYGMRGSKLVSAILHDAKFSEYAKRRTRVIVDSEGDVLWILGVRSSGKYTVQAFDTEYIRLAIK